MAGSIELQWSVDALADLNRFGAFLHEQSPDLAAIVADAIVARTQILTRHPKLGRPIAGREEYRQLVLRVLGGDYIFHIDTMAPRWSSCASSTRVSPVRQRWASRET